MSDDNLENEQIGRRLEKAIGRVPIDEAARVAGCAENSLRRWKKGQSAADARALARLAQAYDFSLIWLLTGVSDETGDELSVMAGIGYIPVPVRDISASAGEGLTALDTDPILHIGFDRKWLKNVVSQLAAANILRVKGDSMEPDLKSGDYIMCDLEDAGARLRDGIYVLRLNDQLLVKRVRMIGRDKAELVSSNPVYDPLLINLSDDDFACVARVVWCSRVLE